MQDNQSSNAPVAEDTYKALHDGLMRTFKNAVIYANSPFDNDRAVYQRAVAELAQALILLESRTPNRG